MVYESEYEERIKDEIETDDKLECVSKREDQE
jgi:hypothetical protein